MSNPNNYQGCPVWQEISSENTRNWQFQEARWIALPKAVAQQEERPRYFLARREFAVTNEFSVAQLHIAADSDFRVFLNGSFVGCGQPRDTVHRVSYRSYDVTALVREGVNCLAIETYGSRLALDSDRMALIAALTVSAPHGLGGHLICTDPATWRIWPAPQWDTLAEEADAYFRQTEIYDSRKEPENWKLAEFDDTAWLLPRLHDAQEIFAHLEPEYRPHSRLVPSIAPPMRRSLALPKRIERLADTLQLDATTRANLGYKMALENVGDQHLCRFENMEHLLSGASVESPAEVMNPYPLDDKAGFYRFWDEHPGEMPAVRHATVILDFGEEMLGHLLIEIEAQGGEIIDFAWGQTLIGGRVHAKLYHQMDGGGMFGFLGQASRYIAMPGRQTWESFHPVPCRYLQVVFRDMVQPLKIHRLALVKSEAPMTVRGRFSSSSEALNWSWQANANTLFSTTQDVYVDNFIRENGAYTGECGGNSLPSTLVICGDEPVARHYSGMITAQRETRRFLLGLADAWQRKRPEQPWIFHHALRMNYALADYALYTADINYVKDELFPAMCDFFSWIEDTVLVESGLIGAVTGWNWFDWADNDCAQGEGAPQNLLYRSTLLRAARLADLLDHKDLASAWENRAEAISTQIFERFWNEDAGLYVDSIVDGKQSTRVFTEHTNFPALGAGLGRNGRKDRILAGMKNPDLNWTQYDVAFFDLGLDALFEAGEDTLAIELMETRYNRFRQAGLQTLPEEFSPYMTMRAGRWNARYRSLSQSAACCPAPVLARHVLGVRPTALRSSQCLIHPRSGHLQEASGEIPTPHGTLRIAWKNVQDSFTLQISLPPGVSAKIILPNGQTHSAFAQDDRQNISYPAT